MKAKIQRFVFLAVSAIGVASLTGCVVYEPAYPRSREVVVEQCPPPPPPAAVVVVPAPPPPPYVSVWVGPSYGHYHGWGRPHGYWR
jgi:hypothetical protein